MVRLLSPSSVCPSIPLTLGTDDRRIHEPLGRAAGLTDAQIAAISDKTSVMTHAFSSGLFPPLLAAALDFCDASSVQVRVPQDIFDRLKAHLDDDGPHAGKKMVEVVAVIGAFHMISRFCVALDIAEVGEEDVPLVVAGSG
jgi:4-carboxymuconolactone decarboxylase